MKSKRSIISILGLVLIALVIGLAKSSCESYYAETKGKEKRKHYISYNFNKEDVSSFLRLPKGVADYDHLVEYSLNNNILEKDLDREEAVKPLTVRGFCDLLYSFSTNYRALKNGFTEDVCPEDALAASETLSDHEEESVKYCLNHGYITKEQVGQLDNTISTNIASRTIYRIAFNTIHMNEYSEDYMDDVLKEYLDVSKAPICRKTKFTFLLENGLMPLNNKGELELDHEMNTLDGLAMLINLEDQMDFLAADSDNPNKGCQPCQYQSLVEARSSDAYESD